MVKFEEYKNFKETVLEKYSTNKDIERLEEAIDKKCDWDEFILTYNDVVPIKTIRTDFECY